MKQQFIIGTLLTACSLSAWAQAQQVNDTTMNRTVVVEQEYTPEITDAAKVNVVPAVPPLTVNKKAVEYETALAPADQLKGTPMQPYAVQEVRRKPTLGYVRLGYGSHGTLDVRANYLFKITNRDRLNIVLGMDGSDGKLDLYPTTDRWNSHFYRTQAGIDYLHVFSKVNLDIAGTYGLSNFNFMPGSFSSKQKFTSGQFHAGVKSTDEEFPIQFRAETNFALFQRQHDWMQDDTREGLLRTEVEGYGQIDEDQRIGVVLRMDNLFYQAGYKNYTSLQLNPYYAYQTDEWDIRLGAHVDPTFSFGKTFRAAPDVLLRFTFADSYSFYAQAKGGKLLNDFRRLEQLSPYGLLDNQLDATYEQLNAALGFKASPVSGLWLHLYGGYQNLRNDLYSRLNVHSEEGVYVQFAQTHTHNIYGGMEATYDYRDHFTLNLSGTYRNWDTRNNDWALALKPSLQIDASTTFRPISPLHITVGYQHVTREKFEEGRLKAVSNLYAGASYQILKGLAVYARGYNLLNQDYQYYLGCQAAGAHVVGGVSFQF